MYSMNEEAKEEPTAFKADPLFSNFKMKSVPNSFRKGEHQIAWNCTGTMLASAQNKIRVFKFNPTTYNFEVEKNEQKGTDQTSYIENIAWHPSHPDVMAYITSNHPQYMVWDVREKNARKITNASKNANLSSLNLCIAYSPDGNTIAYSNRDNRLMFYDARKDEEICESKFEMDIHEYQWDPSGSVILVVGSLGGPGTLHVSDGKDFAKANVDLLERTQSKAHSLKIQCMAVDSKGERFATGSADSLVGLWDMNEMVMVKTFSQSDFAIDKLSFSHDGQFLTSIYNDKTIAFFNTFTGQTANIIERESIVHMVQWHPNQNILAISSDDKKADNEGNIRLYGAFP